MAKDELVSVALIREDLRQLLVASQLYLDVERKATGRTPSTERLELAIKRIGSTASSPEWQPKRDAPEA